MAALQQTEEENFIKLFKLVTSVGTDGLRKSFDRFFLPSNLVTDLKKNETKLKRLNRDRRLTQKQMTILFPPQGGSPTSNDFDVSLMICLIRNLASITPPCNGFDNPPLPSETSIGADIARIKWYRNMLAHADSNRILGTDFQNYTKDLTDAIVRLGGPQYQVLCDDIKDLTLVNRIEIKTLIKQIEDFRSLFSGEIQELQDKVENLEIEVGEIISKDIRGQVDLQLKQWEEEDQLFVSTTAADHVLTCLTSKNCVTVTGNPGVGKTFTVRHVSLLMRQQGYTIVPIQMPKHIKDFIKSGDKLLFVVDDLCGHYTLNQHCLDDWLKFLECIKNLVDNNYCKIIATCRLQVFKDKQFRSLSIFTSCECNLNSKQLLLTKEEKYCLAKKYFNERSEEVSELSSQYDFFPLLCRLYKKNKTANISRYFSNPFKFYERELENFLNGVDGSRYKYCALALCVVFNNNLDEKYLTDDTNSGGVKNIIEDTLSICRLDRTTSRFLLYDSLKTLEGAFVVNENRCFKCIHDKLFDFLSFFMGKNMMDLLLKYADSAFVKERFKWKSTPTEDLQLTIDIPDDYLDKYINRIIADWMSGRVYDFFCNVNLKTQEFTARVIEILNQYGPDKQSTLVKMHVDNEYNDTTLLQSCFVGDINLTQWILNHIMTKSVTSQMSPTPVNRASRHLGCIGSENKAGHFKNYHVNFLNHSRPDGVSPIHIACQYGNLKILNILIESGGDVNSCLRDGVSPLWIACQKGHLQIVKRLIKCRVDINKRRVDGTSPLSKACYKGYIDVVLELLKHEDIRVDLCDNDGCSPLYWACCCGFYFIVKILLNHGADPNKCNLDGVSPLNKACENGHFDVVYELLINDEVKVDLCDNDGYSPLYWACSGGFESIVKILLDYGASPHIALPE